MKKLDDILDKGFDLEDTFFDGAKQYVSKPGYHVVFDYFEVHAATIYPDGVINLSVDKNCDLLESVENDLDEFHVYELVEIV